MKLLLSKNIRSSYLLRAVPFCLYYIKTRCSIDLEVTNKLTRLITNVK
jgi:hypothetical protein